MQTTNKTGTCKRLLALALCLCMVFSMFPAVVHAEEAVAEPVNLLAGSDFEAGVAEWTRGTVVDDPDGSGNKVLTDNWMISKNLYLNDGNYYQLTFKYKANAKTVRQANVRVVDYNANGDVLGVPYSLNDRLYTITNSDGWYDYSVSPTSWEDRDFYFKANVSGDSTYAYSVLEIRGRNLGHYLDDVFLYDCGTSAELGINSGFENVQAQDVLLSDHVAESRRTILEAAGITTADQLNGWNFYGASEVEAGYIGNHAVKYQAPAEMQTKNYNYAHPFNKISVEAGKTYVISFWLNSEAQAASRVHFRADSYSGETKVASNAIEANNLHAGNPTVKDWLGAKTSWQRYQVEYEVPENVDSLDYKIWVAYRREDSTTGMGYPLWLDQLSIVEKVAPHVHKYEDSVVAPTCNDKGYTLHKCSCGDSYTTNEVAATGHTPGTPVKENEVPATCTVDGSYDEVVYCTVETCKAEVSRTSKPITAPGHTPGTAVKENVVVGNCTTPESYDSVVYCTVDTCKAEISRTPFSGTTPGHTPGTPVKENEVPATCTVDGSYDEVVYCTVETCKAKISSTPKTITSSGHDYTHSIVVTDPTLFKEGYTTYTCHCGAYYTSDYTEPGLGYEIGSTGSFLPGLIIAGAGAEKEMSYGGLVLDTEEPFVLYGYGNGETGENDLLTRAQMATLLYRSLSTDNDYIYNPMYFNDVPAGAWYETPVDILSSAGVMVGYNGYFNPNDNLTWAQIITIMARFVDYEPADMPWGYAYSNHWANKAIETAYALGWIEDPLTLKPDQAVTRGEVVEFVNHVFDVFNGY